MIYIYKKCVCVSRFVYIYTGWPILSVTLFTFENNLELKLKIKYWNREKQKLQTYYVREDKPKTYERIDWLQLNRIRRVLIYLYRDVMCMHPPFTITPKAKAYDTYMRCSVLSNFPGWFWLLFSSFVILVSRSTWIAVIQESVNLCNTKCS